MSLFERLIVLADGVLSVLLAYWMFNSIWERKRRKAWTFLFVCVMLLYFVLMFTVSKRAVAELLFCLPLVAATILFKGKVLQKGLFFLLFLAVSFASNVMATALDEQLPLYGTPYTAASHYNSVLRKLLFSKSFTFAAVAAVKIKQKSKSFSGAKKYYFFIPAFLILSTATLILQFCVFPEFTTESQALLIVVTICFTVLVAACILMFVFIDLKKQSFESESKLALAEKLIEQQATSYRAMEEHHRDVIKMRHDQQNFCIGLLGELRKGDTEAALLALERECAVLQNAQKAPGDIIDTVVEIKRKEALEKGVAIDFEYRPSEKLAIPSVDLAVILGNALDNAIEASSAYGGAGKEIRLLVALKNKTIVIQMKNPVTESVNVERLATNKKEPIYHGFGVISMRQLAAKYGGEVVFSCEKGIFTTSIVINNFEG